MGWPKDLIKLEEAKKKMSDSLKGRISPWKGMHPSEESREKMSESHIGQVAWNKGSKGYRAGIRRLPIGFKQSEESNKMRSLSMTEHGHTWVGGFSSTYSTWHSMIQRCENPNSHNYKWYGGRGIKVCDEWHDFKNFLKDMGEKPRSLSIDRYPNNDGNYESGNCRWATQKEQINNSRIVKRPITMEVEICK